MPFKRRPHPEKPYQGPKTVIGPQPGAQTQFASSQAQFVIFGGAAGCGKSMWLICEPLRHKDVPGFTCVIFRRTIPELSGSGSLWEEANGIYPKFGGKMRASPGAMDCRFPNNALIEFRHMQLERDKYTHQGKQYALIEFDEICHFSQSQVFYLVGRNRSTCGVKPYIRATCNPDPNSFVRKLIDWWIGPDGFYIPERSGIIRWMLRQEDSDDVLWFDSEAEALAYPKRMPDQDPISFTYIQGFLDENIKLLQKDPQYRSKLMLLPKVEREQLLFANWDIQPSAGLYFKRNYFDIVDEVPGNISMSMRAWDKASSEPSNSYPDPDWTRGLLMHAVKHPKYTHCVAHLHSLRGSPKRVEDAMLAMAQVDGRHTWISVWRDPGQAGASDIEHIVNNVLSGYSVDPELASRDKVAYAGAFSSAAERGKIAVLKGDWNDAFFNELEAFPDGRHDDIVDAGSLAYLKLSEYSDDSVLYAPSAEPIRIDFAPWSD